MIRTSISISRKHQEGLIKTAERLKISRMDIIELILKRVYCYYKKKSATFKSVSYQKNFSGEKLLIVSVFFDEHEHEKAASHRYLLKRSVSSLVAFGIDNFLDEIVFELQNACLNYVEPIDNLDDFSIIFFENTKYKGWKARWRHKT